MVQTLVFQNNHVFALCKDLYFLPLVQHTVYTWLCPSRRPCEAWRENLRHLRVKTCDTIRILPGFSTKCYANLNIFDIYKWLSLTEHNRHMCPFWFYNIHWDTTWLWSHQSARTKVPTLNSWAARAARAGLASVGVLFSIGQINFFFRKKAKNHG